MSNEIRNPGQRGPRSKVNRFVGMAIVGMLLAVGCGGPEQDSSSSSGTSLVQSQSFLVWNPGSALVSEHTAWHTGACGTAGARRCPHSGEEFLMFHRNYLDRLRDEFERQGLTADITPWIVLPPEMKNSANGWTVALQNAENAIWSMIDPSTGVRFASLEAYGTFIETQYHNSLHGIAAAAFGESAIGPISMSPTSTYFFKIHGLVELHFQRFQHGDFNKDGYSDIFDRTSSTGVNQIWFMNGTGVASKNTINSASAGGCGWYVGATVDLNYDGNLDLVWHGPGCNSVSVWFMNGLNFITSTSALPTVDSSWTLVGAGDFDGDMRPDLVWRDNTSARVSFWKMNNAVYQRSINLPITAGYMAVGVADVTDNGIPDLILRSSPAINTYQYSVLYMLPNFQAGSLFALSNTGGTGMFDSLAGTGRFQARSTAADLLFISKPPAPTGGYFFGLWTSSTMGNTFFTPTAGGSISSAEAFEGPR